MPFAVSCGLLMALSATGPDTLVMPLGTKGKPDTATIAKINAELPLALALASLAKLLPEKVAKKRAKEAPLVAGARCGPAPACLSSYGRKVQVERVLFGLASADGKGVSVDFFLVSSLDGATVQRVTVAYPAGSDVRKITQENAPRLVSTELADMPALQAIAPIKKRQSATAPAEITAAPDSEVPLFSPLQRHAEIEKPQPRSRALLWTGVALAIVGAAGIGAGIYFGVTVLGIKDAGNKPDLPQTAVPAQETRLKDSALYANIGFGAGAAVLAVGAALIATDIVFDARSKATLTVTGQGASVQWAYAW